MSFEMILQLVTESRFQKILNDPERTPFQKAADIHAELIAEGDDARPAQRAKRSTQRRVVEAEEATQTGSGENLI